MSEFLRVPLHGVSWQELLAGCEPARPFFNRLLRTFRVSHISSSDYPLSGIP